MSEPCHRKGINVKNVMHEVAWLGTNVLAISEKRWPGEDDYKSDDCRIIHSREENQRGIAIIVDRKE